MMRHRMIGLMIHVSNMEKRVSTPIDPKSPLDRRENSKSVVELRAVPSRLPCETGLIAADTASLSYATRRGERAESRVICKFTNGLTKLGSKRLPAVCGIRVARLRQPTFSEPLLALHARSEHM